VAVGQAVLLLVMVLPLLLVVELGVFSQVPLCN
jgi:hypothetical protein